MQSLDVTCPQCGRFWKSRGKNPRCPNCGWRMGADRAQGTRDENIRLEAEQTKTANFIVLVISIGVAIGGIIAALARIK